MSLLSKAIQHAADEVSHLTGQASDAAHDVEEAFEKAGKKLVDAVDDFATGLAQIIMDNMIGIRSLRPLEKAVIGSVYDRSLPPLDSMLIVSLAGFSGRPFTLPLSLLATQARPLLGPANLALLLLVFLTAKDTDRYLLFLGKQGYNDAIDQLYYVRPGDVLVHEVGHVWQGFQGAFTWSYVFNSVYYQTSGGAYGYTAGAQWDTYGAEQQAKIIEDWFAGGASVTDPLYPYIKSNVRPGRPHATTDFTTTTSPTAPSTSAAPRPPGPGRTPLPRPGLRVS